MRRRWEEEETNDDNLDEPVTITGRQLRSLRRGARVGLFGVLLAFVAIGLAAWNLISSRGGSANDEVNPASATTATAPADSGAMEMQPAATGAPTATGAAPASAPQAVQPPVPAPAAKQTSDVKPAVRRTRVAAAKVSSPSASGRKPETGVPIDMPTPTLSAPAAAPAPAKPAAPADTAKGS
jgi:hypothetical protein